MRERESYFNDYMLEFRRKEREEKSSAKEKVRLLLIKLDLTYSFQLFLLFFVLCYL